MVALIGLAVLAPVMAVIGVVVWTRLGSPVLFRQTRPGLCARPFVIHKFRTMREPAGEADPVATDATRLTGFGRWLRASSLDELPELWNVVRGDMSLVGPRPLLIEYLPLYSPRQARRHEVRPGLTGWAQVNGRNDMSWEAKFELDVEYVDRRAFSLDLEILVRTVWIVLRGKGVASGGQATTDRFRGSV